MKRVMPGFGLTLGITLLYFGLLAILPLAALVWTAAGAGSRAWATLGDPRTLAAIRVSFGAAALAAAINVPLGVLLAWVLGRYRVPGRRVLDAVIDLPFALPTAVAGIALATLYADTGWLGSFGIAYGPAGIVAALLFIGLPFVVRSVQPVLATLDRSTEEAAMTLDATPWQVFRYVVLPPLAPAVLTGAALAFARGVGEYGSVIFIAGNRPGVSEIVPLLIVTKLDQFDVPGAAVLGAAMVALALLILAGLNALDWWGRPRAR